MFECDPNYSITSILRNLRLQLWKRNILEYFGILYLYYVTYWRNFIIIRINIVRIFSPLKEFIMPIMIKKIFINNFIAIKLRLV